MTRLAEQILAHVAGLPEDTLLAAKSLLHLGSRAGVDQALSRLAERGELIRAGRGFYLRPVASRFGTRALSVERAVEALATQRGEVIASNGAAAANALGLTTQVPIHPATAANRLGSKVLGEEGRERQPQWEIRRKTGGLHG